MNTQGVQKECYVFWTTQPILRFNKDTQGVPKQYTWIIRCAKKRYKEY